MRVPQFPAVKDVEAGEGIGFWCLGDRLPNPAGCQRLTWNTQCRWIRSGFELIYDQSDRLVTIRIHRPGRRVNEAKVGRSQFITPDKIELGMNANVVETRRGPPRATFTVIDPEIGPIELRRYDGITFEIESAEDGGVPIIGGMQVHRK